MYTCDVCHLLMLKGSDDIQSCANADLQRRGEYLMKERVQKKENNDTAYVYMICHGPRKWGGGRRGLPPSSTYGPSMLLAPPGKC